MFCTVNEIIGAAVVVVPVFLLLQTYLHTLTVKDFHRKYVLVTGCDMGFGHLLAKQLETLGFNVFATCLTKEGVNKLQSNSSSRLFPFIMDVTKEKDIEHASELVRSQLPKDTGLWALINNAGVMCPLLFPDMYMRQHYSKVMDVNLYGMIDVTTAFLPLLRRAKGRIINVSSVLGKITPPIFVPYCISKHAVEAYSNGLRCSLKPQNVSVHIIEPGCFATNLTAIDIIQSESRQAIHNSPKDVQQYYGQTFFKSFLSSISVMNNVADTKLQRVVTCHIHAISARYPKHRYRAGYDARLAIPLLRLLPVALSDRILMHIFATPEGVTKY
ncbi:17-beta-hydroxysteroid dehydrogenase type 6-like [Argonauta hians]